MPTTRVPIQRPGKTRITAKAIAAYRRVLENEDDQEARTELFFALGRKPWQYDVLAAAEDEEPGFLTDWRIEDYRKARAIRRELERLK